LTRRQIRDLERQAQAQAPREDDAASSQTDVENGDGIAALGLDEIATVVADEVATEVAESPSETIDSVAVIETPSQPSSPVESTASAQPIIVIEQASADLPPAPPTTRREARAARRDEEATPSSSAPSYSVSASPATSGPESPSAVRTDTIPVQITAAQASPAGGLPAGSIPPGPIPRGTTPTRAMPVVAPTHRKRHIAARGLGIAVMLIVPLIAVATTTPANALLSSADVQAASVAAANAPATTGDEQTVAVGDNVSSITVQRDGYDTATIAQVAAESGIRLEATFTNDPNGTIQWPFKVGVHIGDRFGYRDCAGCSEDHHGQDFNPGLDAPIQAIADGTVSYVEDGDGSLGVHMMIDHVIDGKVVTSVYAHMEHGSMKFALGDKVKVGDVIGNVGSTGMSTGPHLHFEIRLGGINGTWVDPLDWLYANTN
jgi:murein DD-endopeptidase MepM/ murein hydrolase activator NlpD